MGNIISILKERFSETDLILGSDIFDRATSYWSSDPTQSLAVVFARTTDDVSFLLEQCNKLGQTVVTQGGLTGCVEGAISSQKNIILSLEKMNSIEEVDYIGGTMTVQAGAILQTVQDKAAEQGLLFPLDLGARGSCTIGGNVATNAGGINVIRYGMMRNLVLGLEAVLADGTVLSSMNYMLKNNAGYDLKQLFIGTEGTLGVVTRVVLRLFPAQISSNVALVAMEEFSHVTSLLQSMQRRLAGTLSAYEVMWGEYFKAVTEPGWHRAPMDRDYPYYVMIQAEGADATADQQRFESILEECLEGGKIVDAVIPKSAAEVRSLWEIREDFEAILNPKPVFLYDVSLPIRDMNDYVHQVQSNVQTRWPNGRTYVLGHIGDGNLHFFIAPMETDAQHDESDECVYQPLGQYGGSVSAEHGIGTEKKKWLSYSRTADELALMKTLKKALDPNQILNPGVVFDL